MEELFEKLAALRELCNVLDFQPDSKEGRMFNGILEVLDDMAELLSTSVMVEEDEDYYSYSVICPSCGVEVVLTEEDLDQEQELECPKCGDTLIIGAIGKEDLRF